MSFSTQDTIVAIATPPGRGGIGVVRIAGPDASSIALRLISHTGRLEPRHATLARLGTRTDTDAHVNTTDAEVRDRVVAIYFPGPASYTGDDVVELSAHGSPVVLRGIVTMAIEEGARLAEPGEFTLRAFLNGRIDLTQAEAVADLIDAATPLQARTAFDQLDGTLTRAIAAIDAALFDFIARLEASVDFPDEGYHFVDASVLTRDIDALIEKTAALLAGARRGRLIREGLQVAIVGAPNVGKSSLFNALVGTMRAIVTDVPGTTRDLVTEVVDIEGLRVTLVDTAGLRETADVVEREGVERSRGVIATADLILRVFDGRERPSGDCERVGVDSAGIVGGSDPIGASALAGRPGGVRHTHKESVQSIENKELTVINKSDLPGAWRADDAVSVSALTGYGVDELRRRIAQALDVDDLRDRPAITNVRHIALVQRTEDALKRARAAAHAEGGSMSEEFVLADLQDARAALEEITGRRAPADLLEHIFARFCIGK